MSEQRRLSHNVFIALAAIGWADGNLDQEEADAIVRAAVEEGLELDEIEEIERATKEPVRLDNLERDKMSREDRLFVYAVASWMTRLDGQVVDAEVEALDKLGEWLSIPDKPRRAADNVAKEVALLEEGDRPDRYDLPLVRRIIEERLQRAAERKQQT